MIGSKQQRDGRWMLAVELDLESFKLRKLIAVTAAEWRAMRKLIMWNLMSLDGFVEGPNRDISWHSDVWGQELEQLSLEQGKEIGALLFGRAGAITRPASKPSAEPLVAFLSTHRN